MTIFMFVMWNPSPRPPPPPEPLYHPRACVQSCGMLLTSVIWQDPIRRTPDCFTDLTPSQYPHSTLCLLYGNQFATDVGERELDMDLLGVVLFSLCKVNNRR
ncbi:hypothetical protein GOODEAATRI_002983 [Goodea atripinnis]|uniref:Uncharacterized protein n=1 Tax=Goodea atripinnis TaxID=208336 RepID=A0ABV0MY85_9TELE